jgi:endonuclease/exonuclease/phosphatase family metal-dependent hydrolase
MRVSFPLLYEFADSIGFRRALWAVPLIFATPLLAAPVVGRLAPRTVLAGAAGGLALLRIVMQVQLTPHVIIVVAALMFGLLAIGAALGRAVQDSDPRTISAAVFLGLTVDTAIRLLLITWDAAWQHTPLAWLAGTILPLALLVVTYQVVRTTSSTRDGPWWLAAVPGPLLAIQVLSFGNPAFVASSSQSRLVLAGAVVLLGLSLAAAMPPAQRSVVWAARIGLIGALVVLTGPSGLTGLTVLVLVVTGQACVGVLLATACARARAVSPRDRSLNVVLGTGAGALALVAVLLPYQISYEIPLGVPQAAFGGLGALLLAVLAGRSTPAVASSHQTFRRVAVVAPIVALSVPLGLAITWPSPSKSDVAEARVATYNIHSAIDWDGRLDPSGIAAVLDDGGAEIALVQEVSRGWPLSGGLDDVEWLSRRLGADYAYGPAADNQFGNAVLSTRPIARFWTGTLDRGEGPMHRGYVGASVIVGDGLLDVWSTHLQHQTDNTQTRRDQANQILDRWVGVGQAVFGGDLNSRPDSADIEPWFDSTGLVSVLDESDLSDTNTSPAIEPDHRVDWLIISPDLEFRDAEIPRTLASDHLPVFATITLPS